MKMYKVTVSEPDEGHCVTWFSSETKAKQFALGRADEGGNPLVQAIEFPSGKKAIIDWLNTNFNRDNG